MNHRLGRKAAAGILCLGLVCQNAGLIPASAASSSVTINEVCSKNTTIAAPDGNFYDWVELYNSGNSAVDLSGWGLSDKATKPFKFKIPNGTKIAAKSYLVIYCDSTAGETNTSIAPFGMSGSGETLTLSDANGNAADTLTFGSIASDTSYGQYPDGSGNFFDLTCTPGRTNVAPEGSAAVATPAFSLESGYYEAGKTVSIQAPSGTTVYYTTDGTVPTTSSQRYTSPFTLNDVSNNANKLSAERNISTYSYNPPSSPVDKANIIRAVAVDSQGRVSDVITRTYFVGKTNSGYYKDMKVVSLVTDPDNLFNYDTGIYVLGKHYAEDNSTGGNQGGNQGGFPGGMPGWGGGIGGGFSFKQPWEMEANYTQSGKEWERPATMTVFDKGKKVIDQDVGIRIKGGASRHNAQKSFNIYARLDYGAPEMTYDFFDGTSVKAKNGKAIKSYTTISLRDGGNDNNNAIFRDSLNQSLVADRDCAHQAMSECIVFIDGEFWGIYQICEKLNDAYISDHYGVKKSDVAMVKESELEEGSDSDLQDWNNLVQGAANGSLSYAQICEKIDIQSFMDYFASQIYWSNQDWPKRNIASWRSNTIDSSNPYADGKWRMIFFDTEYGQGLYGSQNTSANYDNFSRLAQDQSDVSKMFNALLKNDQFAKDFARTMMDLANYNFEPNRVAEKAKYYSDNFSQQAADTFKRFGSNNNAQSYQNQWNTIVNFYRQRFDPAERSLRQAAKLSAEPSTLTVQNSSNSGEIQLNTLKLGTISSWSGKYHKDYDLTLSVAPKEGVSFDHWEISGAQLTSGSKNSGTIKVKLTSSNATVKAVYSGQGGGQTVKTDYPTNIKVNYNSQYHQIQFLWDKVEGADKYGIAVYLAGKWRVQTSSITTNSYITPKNLTPGMTYKVAIAARVNGQWNTTDPIKNAVTVTVK
ncbi:MAG: CotH kinase family protein [Ruminococcus sp.]|uniref:CotH kinase family protein n=1 Tax=Ruminococcus sp. TaxID=41978 RepID=UPI0025E999EE|nr:CotH kinase family protein [Ruminococcus sp.]MBO4866563.1 CotH kinase family protein [Ruminococcus sp.]